VQGASSTKKINAIRGWTKEDMMKAIDDVEFNGYSVRETTKKYGIAPTSLHYWINGLTHTKRKGPLTMLIKQEEEEVVVWCKEMVEMGHGMELIQLKANVAQICQYRLNPFKDGFPRKSWWVGFKKRHPELVL
jgi:transposase-like protein